MKRSLAAIVGVEGQHLDRASQKIPEPGRVPVLFDGSWRRRTIARTGRRGRRRRPRSLATAWATRAVTGDAAALRIAITALVSRQIMARSRSSSPDGIGGCSGAPPGMKARRSRLSSAGEPGFEHPNLDRLEDAPGLPSRRIRTSLPAKPELLGQSHGLAAAVHEELCRLPSCGSSAAASHWYDTIDIYQWCDRRCQGWYRHHLRKRVPRRLAGDSTTS